MAEPPVTIHKSRYGATAECHLCPWYMHVGPITPDRRTPATERASAAWADHWQTAHTDRSIQPSE